METSPVTCRMLEDFYHIDGHQFEKQYKEILSGYRDWNQLVESNSKCKISENFRRNDL
ncbi:MAG: ISAon1 family transposase, partial [Prevotella koreensis]